MGTHSVNRSERLAIIEHMLFRSEYGLRVVEIAEACGVDRRTVYRDLSLLTDIGIPITQANGRFSIKTEHYLANVRLSQDEAMAFFLAARVLSQHIDQHNPHLVSALRKLSRAFPDAIAAHLHRLTESAYSGAVDPGYVSTLEEITCAWAKRRHVKLWCALPEYDQSTTCEFAIYFIEPAPDAQLYIVGCDMADRRIRVLPVRRVKRAKMLRATYDIPVEFDPQLFLSDIGAKTADSDPGEGILVALHFSAQIAHLMSQRIWHPTQQIDRLADGSCIMTLHVSDWRDLLPWIRAWGSYVKPLEPLALCHHVDADTTQVNTEDPTWIMNQIGSSS